MTRRRVLAAMLGAVLLAACGGDDVTATASLAPAPGFGGTTSPGTADTVVLADNLFTPSEVSVHAAGEIALQNEDDAVHNFSVEGSDIDVDIGMGEDQQVTVDLDPGTYTMFCEFHRSLGMEGTLTVT